MSIHFLQPPLLGKHSACGSSARIRARWTITRPARPSFCRTPGAPSREHVGAPAEVTETEVRASTTSPSPGAWPRAAVRRKSRRLKHRRPIRERTDPTHVLPSPRAPTRVHVGVLTVASIQSGGGGAAGMIRRRSGCLLPLSLAMFDQTRHSDSKSGAEWDSPSTTIDREKRDLPGKCSPACSTN